MLASVLLSLLAASSAPAPAMMEPVFSSTVVSTYADGRTAKLWINRDGSYSGEGRRHDPSSGRWRLKGEKICLQQSRPLSLPFSFCTPLVAAGVGASWPGKSVTGEPIIIRIVAGR